MLLCYDQSMGSTNATVLWCAVSTKLRLSVSTKLRLSAVVFLLF